MGLTLEDLERIKNKNNQCGTDYEDNPIDKDEIGALIEALGKSQEALKISLYYAGGTGEEAPCHIGITTEEKCGRCSKLNVAKSAILPRGEK